MSNLRKKYGIVILMDALGARQYSEEKIKKFLQARSKLNSILAHQAGLLKSINKEVPAPKPVTYTFGDTLVVTCELRVKKHHAQRIYMMLLLMQNYLFHSMEEGIVFRGAFSIGTYFDDAASNTVMGEALTDAATWYEQSDWFGLASTPQTNNVLEFLFYEFRERLHSPKFVLNYPVPMKDGRAIELYTVSWAGRFFQDKERYPEKKFLEVMTMLPVPLGTESKHINSKKYFYEVARLLAIEKNSAST